MYSTKDVIKKSLKKAFNFKMLWVFSMLLTGTFNIKSNIGFSMPNLNQRPHRNFEERFQDSVNSSVLGLTAVASPFGSLIEESTLIETTEASETTDTAPFYPTPAINYGEYSDSFDIEEYEDLMDLYDPSDYNYDPTDFPGTYGGIYDPYNPISGILGEIIGGFSDVSKSHIIGEISLIGILTFLVILIGACIVLIVFSWATGGLLEGIKTTIEDNTYTLKSLGLAARKNLKSRVNFSIRISLLRLLIVLIYIALSAFIFLFIERNYILKIILSLVLIGIQIIVMLDITLGSIFAVRLISHDDIRAKGALKKGIELLKTSMGKVIKLLVVNFLIVFASLVLIIGFSVLVSYIMFSVFAKASGILLILLSIFNFIFSLGFSTAIILFIAFIVTYNNYCFTYVYNYAYSKTYGDKLQDREILNEEKTDGTQ